VEGGLFQSEPGVSVRFLVKFNDFRVTCESSDMCIKRIRPGIRVGWR